MQILKKLLAGLSFSGGVDCCKDPWRFVDWVDSSADFWEFCLSTCEDFACSIFTSSEDWSIGCVLSVDSTGDVSTCDTLCKELSCSCAFDSTGGVSTLACFTADWFIG